MSDRNKNYHNDGLEFQPVNDLPDLYNILGLTSDVCKEADCNEIIKKAYIKKAKLCHPDKFPGRKDVSEIFELLTSAYDILKDDKQRENYNHKLRLNKQSSNDFLKLRKETTEYMNSVGDFKPATLSQNSSFKEKMKELDSFHGYDTSIESSISKTDARKKLKELTQTRAIQDVKLKPEKIFEDGQWNNKIFNDAFDKYNKNDNSIIEHNGVPSAWNDFGTIANYSNFDKLDKLYVDDNARYDTGKDSYGNADFGSPAPKITKNDLLDLKGADYVDGHNILGDDYYKEMKNKLRSRQTDAFDIENMKYSDFKRDDTAGYGIFDQLGFNFDDRLSLDDDSDISKKFNKLIAERQKN